MTSFLIGLLYVVEVVVCLLLALAVMLQKPKEGGLGGAIGGGMSEAVFGADASNVLIKVTIWLGSIFLVNTLLLARLTSVGHSQSVMADVSEPKQQPVEQQAPATAVPDAPLPSVEELPAPAAKPEAKPAPAKPAPAPAKPAAQPVPAPAKPAVQPTPAPAKPAPAKPAAQPAPAPAKPAAQPAPAAKK